MSYDGTLKFDTKIDSSGFQKGISSISSIAKGGLKATTSALGIVATGIGAIGTFALKAGSDFESSMSNVAAIAGLTSKEAGSDYDILRNKAKEVASQSKFTAAETADALSYMAMAGWKTQDMTAALSSVVNLAAASGQDLASTSDILTDAITALGHKASDTTGIVDEFGNQVSYATHFADVLAAASTSSNTKVGIMGETFKYAATMAGALGFSAEDLAVAIGLMANSGIKGTQAGTALRSIFSRLAAPPKECATAMEALGISLTDGEGKMKSLSTVMQEMRGKFSGLSETQQTMYAKQIAGQEAMSGLLAIVNATDEEFNELTTAIQNSNGAAQQMADKGAVATLREFAGQLQQAYDNNGIYALIDSAGDVFTGLITKIAEASPQIVGVAMTVAESFISSLLKNKAKVGSAGAELVTTLVAAVVEFAGEFWSCGVELFTSFIQGIAENTPKIVTSAKETIIKFGTALAENAASISSSAIQIISALATGLVDNLPQLISIGRNRRSSARSSPEYSTGCRKSSDQP